MSPRLRELELKREMLLMRISGQRIDLARGAQVLRTPLAIVDRGVAAVDFLKTHPLLVFGVFFGFGLVRPRRAFGLMRRGYGLWRFYRNARATILGN